ncbi:MAG: hypothetical protein JSV09_15795 [Thermoplasmata archaeon]|nr:MAG: hypothetical protein JSV09_15795 [Thermoplasmata archaeon]
MESRNIGTYSITSHKLKFFFERWLYDRKEFIIPFFVLFVVVDPLMTYIGTNAFNFREGNLIVSTLVEAEHGWVIWLAMKMVFGLVGTIFMFWAYYVINTEKLTRREKQRAVIFEYGAWSFLICFLFIIILHWASIIVAG